MKIFLLFAFLVSATASVSASSPTVSTPAVETELAQTLRETSGRFSVGIPRFEVTPAELPEVLQLLQVATIGERSDKCEIHSGSPQSLALCMSFVDLRKEIEKSGKRKRAEIVAAYEESLGAYERLRKKLEPYVRAAEQAGDHYVREQRLRVLQEKARGYEQPFREYQLREKEWLEDHRSAMHYRASQDIKEMREYLRTSSDFGFLKFNDKVPAKFSLSRIVTQYTDVAEKGMLAAEPFIAPTVEEFQKFLAETSDLDLGLSQNDALDEKLLVRFQVLEDDLLFDDELGPDATRTIPIEKFVRTLLATMPSKEATTLESAEINKLEVEDFEDPISHTIFRGKGVFYPSIKVETLNGRGDQAAYNSSTKGKSGTTPIEPKKLLD